MLPLLSQPPCTYSKPPAEVKPWLSLAKGAGPLPAAGRSCVQIMVEVSNKCRSSRSPADGGGSSGKSLSVQGAMLNHG